MSEDRWFLVNAARYVETIRAPEFAPIISGAHNDPENYAECTNPGKTEVRIGRFKPPLSHDDPKKRDPLAFLIVKSMPLTGFDAPRRWGGSSTTI